MGHAGSSGGDDFTIFRSSIRAAAAERIQEEAGLLRDQVTTQAHALRLLRQQATFLHNELQRLQEVHVLFAKHGANPPERSPLGLLTVAHALELADHGVVFRQCQAPLQRVKELYARVWFQKKNTSTCFGAILLCF